MTSLPQSAALDQIGVEDALSRNAMADLCVLVADDDRLFRTAIVKVLGRLGVGRILAAEDGARCLAILEQGVLPDLAFLDVRMPGVSGIEVCEKLRSDHRWRHIPVIFGTGVDSESERFACFRAGAADLIHKPFFLEELQARLRVHLEKICGLRALAEYHARMEDALRVTAAMQRDILPLPSMLADYARDRKLHVSAHFQPAEAVGGDLWFAEPLEDGRLFWAVLDFNGHGLIAAINTFRVHSMASGLKALRTDPVAWLAQLNDLVVSQFDGRVYATGICGLLDPKSGHMDYASAGSPPPILMSGPSGQWQPLPSSGLMLGVKSGFPYDRYRAQLNEGGNLLLYSDGALRDVEGREFDCQHLAELWLQAGMADSDFSAQALLRHLPACLARHDDIVLLVLGR